MYFLFLPYFQMLFDALALLPVLSVVVEAVPLLLELIPVPMPTLLLPVVVPKMERTVVPF
jgi:hypothetical protein